MKSASKIGSSTNFSAACTTRSVTVGMPSLRILPPLPGLGIMRSRTGIGRNIPAFADSPQTVQKNLDASVLDIGGTKAIDPGGSVAQPVSRAARVPAAAYIRDIAWARRPRRIRSPHWRDGQMMHRWRAAGMVKAGK